MITIELNSIGKKFEGRWIFRNINLSFKQGDAIAITGYNGSGKSTLLQIISGYQSPSEGALFCTLNGKEIDINEWYHQIACVTPLLEMPEELTLRENIAFFRSFKPLQEDFSAQILADLAQLSDYLDKPLKYFSSGMKQRAKLSLAILSDASVLLLDEPLSNLDRPGVEWFLSLMKKYAESKILIICSNKQPEEMALCNSEFDVSDHYESTNS
jgi:ABC-type multidrug transport system ATPase subunit